MDQKTAIETIKKFLTKDGIGELPEWVQDAAETFCGFDASKPATKTAEVSYHIRVYSPDSLEWRETFYTEDFDTALGEWQGESEGESFDRRVELVEERIIEVSEP